MNFMTKPIDDDVRVLLWTDPTDEKYSKEIIFKDLEPNVEEEVPIPAFCSRLAKITAKAEKNREEQRKKEEKQKRTLDEALDAVKKLAPRISMLLELANACKRAGIKFPTDTKKYGYGEYDGRRGYNFIADGIEHHVGFMERNGKEDFQYIGIYNGGYNGPYDFYVNQSGRCGQRPSAEYSSNVTMVAADRIEYILKFLAEFDAFEAGFLNWIDSFE